MHAEIAFGAKLCRLSRSNSSEGPATPDILLPLLLLPSCSPASQVWMIWA